MEFESNGNVLSGPRRSVQPLTFTVQGAAAVWKTAEHWELLAGSEVPSLVFGLVCPLWLADFLVLLLRSGYL